jgi:hypothetical protein
MKMTLVDQAGKISAQNLVAGGDNISALSLVKQSGGRIFSILP